MKVDIKDYKGVKVITPSGDIDMYSSPLLRKELLNLVNKKVVYLLVDLSGISYIDSSGIATFVEGLKGMMTYGGRLKFFGIPERVMEILSFAKLDRVFEIYESIEDAVKN
jgi:anti-sigma B factor antagonist